MRTVTRTGVTLSVVAALTLYGLQLIAGLMVTLGIIVIGACAGLSVAKWLERDWYGRQLDAGARAGAIACGVAGLSSALYLLGQGPDSITALAARSHILGISLAPLALALSPLGVAGADVVAVVVATLLGVATAAFTAQLFGWGKDKRSLRIIAQARLAAQAQQYGELGAPATGSGERPPTPSVHLYGRTSGSATSATGAPAPRRTAAPAPDAAVVDASLPFTSWDDPKAPAAQVAPKAPAAQVAPKTLGKAASPPRNERSADKSMSDEERAALAAWEAALANESQPGAAKREPKTSEFLNQPTPAPRRNRKKQSTRDWLC